MSILLQAILALAISTPFTTAQNVPQPSPPNATAEYLAAHNIPRAAVGVAPIKWSTLLANATSLLVTNQRDRQGCKFADLKTIKFGANQFWAGGMTITPHQAVESWVAQKIYYNYSGNSCAPNHSCGGYTQVVWKKSVELGCAQATCVKEQASLIICFYNPPGNVVGERPY